MLDGQRIHSSVLDRMKDPQQNYLPKAQLKMREYSDLKSWEDLKLGTRDKLIEKDLSPLAEQLLAGLKEASTAGQSLSRSQTDPLHLLLSQGT